MTAKCSAVVTTKLVANLVILLFGAAGIVLWVNQLVFLAAIARNDTDKSEFVANKI